MSKNIEEKDLGILDNELTEEVKEAPEAKTEESPILRATPSLPDNMIHKHLDNFLAKIAGETPVDEEVRDSTEYWLNKIAEAGGGGGEDLHLYAHVIHNLQSNQSNSVSYVIFDNSSEPYNTAKVSQYLYSKGLNSASTENHKWYPATGGYYLDNVRHNVIGVYANSSSGLFLVYMTASGIATYGLGTSVEVATIQIF